MVRKAGLNQTTTGLPCTAVLLLLLAGAPEITAQQVVGRTVTDPDGAPLMEALIILQDDHGRERARTVTSSTGGFDIRAPAAGRFRLRVQRIGQQGWESPPFDLAADQIWRPTLKVPERPFALQELSASGRRPNCKVTLGDATLGATLLESAQTALGLAEAEVASGRRIYATKTYRRTVPVVGPPEDSVVSQGRLAGWPIQSVDPDSLRRAGFVQGEWPAPNPMSESPQLGPTYFGPDARVLFTDWFLGTHCILVDDKTRQPAHEARIVARFEPARGTRKSDGLIGSLEFDRRTLALQSMSFQFAARPRWAPRGTAGGELRFARLPDGAWLPVSWIMRAPMPKVAPDGRRYRFFGVVEVGGQVTAVRRSDGQPDIPAEKALHLRG